jgi:N6-adenosine-specific RNA methylase IME4
MHMAARFKAVLADPAWPFDDVGSRLNPGNEGCADGYTTASMPVEQIAAMNVGPRFCTDDALLFLWSTWTHVLDGTLTEPSSAVRVVLSWGFTPKTIIPWAKLSRTKGESKARWRNHPAIEWLYQQGYKLQIGGGHYVRNMTEPLIVASRRPMSLETERMLPGIIAAARTTHSRKPLETYSVIETMTDGPYLELFARRAAPREGWRFVGDQAQVNPQPQEA